MQGQGQLQLLELSPAEPSGDSIEERFEAFHIANPHIFRALHNLAIKCRNAGWSKVSIKLLFERLRWEYAWQTRGEPYRLNNSFTAYYARVLIAFDERLEDLFETREQRDPYEVDLERLLLVDGEQCSIGGSI